MHDLRRLIREVHRRSLWQVLGVYLAGSWVAIQVVQTLTSSIGLPDWVPAAAVALLVVGLPIVTATAVVQEGGPARSEDGSEEGRGEKPAGAEGPGVPGESASASGAAPAESGGRPEPAFLLERVLSWSNALLGGVAAFTLLGLAAALYMASRALGVGPAAPLVARGVLDEREPIVLAEFESATGDSLLAVTATEALRIDLSQSPAVRLADPARVRGALQRMRRDAEAPLTRTVAREVALREGIQAVIGGELNRAGGGYLLTADVISAEGSILTSHRVSAADSTEIIPAIDGLSRGLRKKIGESIKSVRESPPLFQVTTTSLEALRKYSQAMVAEHAAGERDRALTLLEEAIALDSTFAMAWRKIGILLFNRGERPELRRDALTRAHELRDRLTEAEKYRVEGAYHLAVTRDYERAVTAYENLIEVDPDNSGAYNNLAWIYGERFGDHERAETLYREATRIRPSDVVARLNAAETQVNLGKFAEARATVERAEGTMDGDPPAWLLGLKAQVAALQRRFADADSAVDRLLRLHGHRPYDRAKATVLRAALAALRGRVVEAAALVGTSVRDFDGPEARVMRVGQAQWLGALHLHVRGDTARAVAEVARALDGLSADSLPPPLLVSRAIFSAQTGRPALARRHLARIREAGSGPETAGDTLLVRGAIALAEGRPEAALPYLRRAAREEADRYTLALLGTAHDRVGQPDSAVAHLERSLRTHRSEQVIADALHLPGLLRRLGELHEARGDTARAVELYRRFVDLWREADPELQPRVEAVRERVQALGGAGESVALRESG